MISRRKFLTASVLGIGAVAATGVVGASQTDPLAKTFDLFQASYPVGGFPDNENYGQHGVIGFVGVWLEKDSNPEQRLNWMTSLLERVQENYAKGNDLHKQHKISVVDAAICTAYVDRHQTINDFARDAISRFPEATHIYLWLGTCHICYEKSATPGEWKNEWSVLNWGGEKCYHLSESECHKWINDNLCD